MTTLEKSDEQFLSNLRGKTYDHKIYTEEELMDLSMEDLRKIHSDRVKEYITNQKFGEKLYTVCSQLGKDDNSSYTHYTFIHENITFYYDAYSHWGKITVDKNDVFHTSRGQEVIKPGDWCDVLEEQYKIANEIKISKELEQNNKEKLEFIRNKLI